MEYLPKNSFGTCDACGYSYRVAMSHRSKACPNCEHVEKHGVTIFEAKRQKDVERQRAKPLKAYTIPKYSAKGKVKATEIQRVKTSLKSKAAEGYYMRCEGCGQYHIRLDGSHKIPLSKNSALAAVPENMRLLCRRCHNVWEHWAMPALVNLHCFFEDMEFLLAYDRTRFYKIYFMVLEYSCRNPSPEMGRVVRMLDEIGAGE